MLADGQVLRLRGGRVRIVLHAADVVVYRGRFLLGAAGGRGVFPHARCQFGLVGQVEEGYDPGWGLVAGPPLSRLSHHLLRVISIGWHSCICLWLDLVAQKILIRIDFNVQAAWLERMQLLILVIYLIVRLNPLIIIMHRHGKGRRRGTIRDLRHRRIALLQVRVPVLSRSSPLDAMVSAVLPVRPNRYLLLMHRAGERLILLLVLLRLDFDLSLLIGVLQLLLLGAASSLRCRLTRRRNSCREVNILILYHSQELNRLRLRHILHVAIQLVHKLSGLCFAQGLVATGRECDDAILPNGHLSLLSLEQPPLVRALTLFQVRDTVHVLVAYQLLIRFDEVLLNCLCSRVIALLRSTLHSRALRPRLLHLHILGAEVVDQALVRLIAELAGDELHRVVFRITCCRGLVELAQSVALRGGVQLLDVI